MTEPSCQHPPVVRFVDFLDIADQPDVDRIERIPLEQRMPHATTYELISAVADIQPDHAAIHWMPAGAPSAGDRTYTYRDLITRIRQVANLVRRRGLTRTDVVAYLLPNLPETHFMLAGVQAACIVLPLNPMLESKHLAAMLTATGARMLVTARGGEFDSFEHKARAIAQSVPGLDVVCVDSGEPRPDGLIALLDHIPGDRLEFTYDAAPTDYSSYIHTGGTTGVPKIARSTHWAEASQGWLMSALAGLTPNDVSLGGLPLFHATAVRANGIAIWAAGASLVLMGPSGFRNPHAMTRLWETIEVHRVSVLVAVATVYSALLNVPLDGRDISSLRLLVSGAAPLPIEIIERFERQFALEITEGYGLTEGCCMSARNPQTGARKVGSVGLRVPYQLMKTVVLSDDGRYIRDCLRDEVGVLVMKGPNVVDGYVGDSSDLFVADGWLNTGDLARQDTDGYFFITGRRKDLIIRSGHNIDPQLIENVLYTHPNVAMAAAVGMPDIYAGELPVAYVTLKPGVTTPPKALREFAFDRITERPAAPKQVFIIPEMPTTAVGKPSKLLLRCKATETAVIDMVRRRLPAGTRVAATARPDHRYGIHVDITISPPAGSDPTSFNTAATSLIRSFSFDHTLTFKGPHMNVTTEVSPTADVMQRIELPRWGAENLSLTSVSRPEPGPGQVLVQMKAIALNYRDLLVINGLYNPKMPLPLVPVSDGAGLVVKRGPGAHKFGEGALVMPTHVSGWTGGRPDPAAAPRGGPSPGVLAEYVAFDERDLVEAPNHLDAIEAATLPCAAVTAWNGLFGGAEPVKPGDRVLILGTGGVGLFALQFAKVAGAEVIITSKNDTKLAMAATMGADHLINYSEDPDWGRTAREVFGGVGADIVIELGGAGTLHQSLRAVRRGGTVAMIGSVTGAEVDNLALPPIFMRNVTIRGLAVGSRDVFEDMALAIARHGIRPVVHHVFPGLGAFSDALDELASGSHFGKVVVEMVS
jgi:fatty-acyl-CoA synthase